jgi:hypothetical protein
MSTHVKRLLGNRLTLALAIVITILLLGLATVQPRTAGACPSQTIEYTYYTDGTYTTPCGWKIITCSCGVYRDGCSTAYYTIDWSEC